MFLKLVSVTRCFAREAHAASCLASRRVDLCGARLHGRLTRSVLRSICGRRARGCRFASRRVGAKKYDELYKLDQLTEAIAKQEAFFGWQTPKPDFPPTFKVARDNDSLYHEKKNRIPSWCDRVLYKSLPQFESEVEVVSYESKPEFKSSDHKPIVGTFNIKRIGRKVGVCCAFRDVPACASNTLCPMCCAVLAGLLWRRVLRCAAHNHLADCSGLRRAPHLHRPPHRCHSAPRSSSSATPTTASRFPTSSSA